jgi:septal ring factor EnvC (AmiA/AmiB activator)
MPAEWIKNNLSLGNLVMVGVGLFGLGTYYTGAEMRSSVHAEQLKEAKDEIKELKQKIANTEHAASEIGWKVDRLTADVAEIKLDVKATRKAVQ